MGNIFDDELQAWIASDQTVLSIGQVKFWNFSPCRPLLWTLKELLPNKSLATQVKVGLLVHTNSPEMSEYFLAGLKDGGASMVLSEKKKKKVQLW
jgi:hypothetical protein